MAKTNKYLNSLDQLIKEKFFRIITSVPIIISLFKYNITRDTKLYTKIYTKSFV